MTVRPMGEVMASRSLTAERGPDGPVFPIALELGRPRPAEDGESWVCPCRIAGLGDEPVREVHGVDGIQAVDLAGRLVRDLLVGAAREQGLTFRWGEETGLDATDVVV
ncbi:DUF6968 family protein (plasmid) [Streptomyces sp. BI20]|uniref:DUF6968 family protein n=1 Tax=Streptomyces sp. BI20 TaxID=3403460 RepID=UPI003C77B269